VIAGEAYEVGSGSSAFWSVEAQDVTTSSVISVAIDFNHFSPNEALLGVLET
jgi:hypothetical protein